MKEYGFIALVHDDCVYKLMVDDEVLIVGCFVDDLICSPSSVSYSASIA